MQVTDSNTVRHAAQIIKTSSHLTHRVLKTMKWRIRELLILENVAYKLPASAHGGEIRCNRVRIEKWKRKPRIKSSPLWTASLNPSGTNSVESDGLQFSINLLPTIIPLFPLTHTHTHSLSLSLSLSFFHKTACSLAGSRFCRMCCGKFGGMGLLNGWSGDVVIEC